MSVLQFGPAAITHEAAWIPLGYLRHDLSCDVVGKFSAVMRLFLRRLLVDDDSIRAAGTLVEGISEDGGPAMIYLGVRIFSPTKQQQWLHRTLKAPAG